MVRLALLPHDRIFEGTDSCLLRSGTNERICLVKGKIASVMKVVEVIMEKIREKVDANTPADPFDHKGVERSKEVCSIFKIFLHFSVLNFFEVIFSNSGLSFYLAKRCN